MNDNQRQDWWPENNTDSSNNNSNISSDSTSWEHSGNYQQPEDNPPDQKNEWNNNSYQENTNDGWNQTPTRPPFRSVNSMAVASLVMGILSVVLICCGFSFCFGALGIIFALLSRRNGPMDPQAKAGLGLSIGGTVIGIAMILFLTIGNSQYSEIMQEYERFYNEYEDDYYEDDIFENYYENLPFENSFPDDNNPF